MPRQHHHPGDNHKSRNKLLRRLAQLGGVLAVVGILFQKQQHVLVNLPSTALDPSSLYSYNPFATASALESRTDNDDTTKQTNTGIRSNNNNNNYNPIMSSDRNTAATNNIPNDIRVHPVNNSHNTTTIINNANHSSGATNHHNNNTRSNNSTTASLTNNYHPNDYNISVAICAVQKWGEQYLDEFMDYYLHVLGFDHIYIYDNSDDFELNRTQSFQRRNGKYISAKYPNGDGHLLTLRHHPGKVQQRQSYWDCTRRIQEQKLHDWVAVIDFDEFIVLKDQRLRNIQDLLYHVEQKAQQNTKNAKMGGLALNWYQFDHNNQANDTGLPMTLRLQRRNLKINYIYKTIAKVDALDVSRMQSEPHSARYKPGYAGVDTNGRVVHAFPVFAPNGPSDVAVINHYHMKSLEEYASRCGRGRVGVANITKKWYRYCLPWEQLVKEEIGDNTTTTNGNSTRSEAARNFYKGLGSSGETANYQPSYFIFDSLAMDDSAWVALQRGLPERYGSLTLGQPDSGWRVSGWTK